MGALNYHAKSARVYINNLAELYGLSYTLKYGKITAASLSGKEIPPSRAKRIIVYLNRRSLWIDRSFSVHSDLPPAMEKKIVRSINVREIYKKVSEGNRKEGR